MQTITGMAFDTIGYWSETKLKIIRQYTQEYSKIFASRRDSQFHHVYIDAFAGSGRHISRATRKFVPGSPLVIIEIEPPFKEYYFMDIDGAKVTELRRAVSNQPEVHVLKGEQ